MFVFALLKLGSYRAFDLLFGSSSGIAVIHGEQKDFEGEEPDGRNSPPTVEHSRIMDVGDGVPALAAKEKPPINVVGDVGGRIAIMVVSNKF